MTDDTRNGKQDGNPTGQDSETTARELADSLGQVIHSALGVGVALSRLAAKATGSGSGSGSEEQPAAGAGPVSVIVHYSLTAVRNMTGTLTGILPDLMPSVNVRPVSADGSAAPGAHAPASNSAMGAMVPSVHQGATLRVPLSVQNPANEPLLALTPRCESLEFTGSDSAHVLTHDAFHFAPAALSVAGRDFEKLTVLVDVPADAAPGRYTARIDSPEGGLALRLDFDILEAEHTPPGA
ncbi:hypothetical protein [Paraburkholderia sp. XV]|uniref:hypothetical protein n=1 Tax=Paraburkholderia sp. XV TaxID=2831520 RepID=UPI001CD2958A|nr:hypothetical protein [Paraburkholderia sp. XV]